MIRDGHMLCTCMVMLSQSNHPKSDFFCFFPKIFFPSLSCHSSSLFLSILTGHPHQLLPPPELFGSLSQSSTGHFQEGVDQLFVYLPHRREEVPLLMPLIEAHFQFSPVVLDLTTGPFIASYLSSQCLPGHPQQFNIFTIQCHHLRITASTFPSW
ncbi:hypothetical protein CFP56_023029 [Quercus suber]|uniref:Uncharacterized protein n=1 Tax=Quercus suber TaxID=58331 RepID=A0AAW0KAR4_QUESU